MQESAHAAARAAHDRQIRRRLRRIAQSLTLHGCEQNDVLVGLDHGFCDRCSGVRASVGGPRIVRATRRKFKQVQVFRGFLQVRINPFHARSGRHFGKHLVRFVLVIALALLIAACATPITRASSKVATEQSVHAVAVKQDLPLTLIAAEYALQRNDLVAAAQGYADASLLSIDPQIAEQATRLALAAKQIPLARSALQRWQALDPKAIGIVQSRAWIALVEGDTEAAFTALAELATRGGDKRWRPIAQVLIGVHENPQAVAVLSRLATPERLGDNDQDWVAMSQLAFKLDDIRLAERLSTQAVSRFKSADAYAWSAQLALERGDKKAARLQFAEAIRLDPDSLRLRTGYAALLAETGDNAGAARALASGKQTDVVYGARAAYAARSEDKSQLVALYREIEADNSERSGKRIYLLGQLAELIGKDAQAIEWYRQVPEDDENWFVAGMRIVVLANKLDDSKAATEQLASLRIAAAVDPRQTMALNLLEAELLIGKAKKTQALAVYSLGLEQFPGEERLLYARAMLLIDMDDLAGAERDLRSVLAADPESADAMNALGYTLVDRTDRLAEAVALIEQAIKIKPDEPAIIDSYGWAQYRLGNIDEAVKFLRKAYALQPDSEVAAHLGEVLWVSGEHKEARQIWEQGRKKDADNKVLIETMKRLAS